MADDAHVVEIHTEEFPIAPAKFSRLVDPKSPELLKELGGLDGVCLIYLFTYHYHFTLAKCL